MSHSFWKKGSSAFKPYKVGDKVGMKIQGRSGLSKKLRPRYKGPYTIKHVNTNQKSYQLIFKSDTSCEVRAHHSQLRPWYDRPKYLQKSPIFTEPLGEKNSEPDLSNTSAFIPGLSSQFHYADVPVAFTLPSRNLIPVNSAPNRNSRSNCLPEEPVLSLVVCSNMPNSVIPLPSSSIPQFVLQPPPSISSYSSSFGSYLVENTPMNTPNQSFQETCPSNAASMPNKFYYNEMSSSSNQHGTISQLERFIDQYDTPEYFPTTSTPVRSDSKFRQSYESGLDDINLLMQSMVVQGSVDPNQTIPSIVSFSDQSPQGEMSALPELDTSSSTSVGTSVPDVPDRRITRRIRREFLPDMTTQNALDVLFDNPVP